MSALAERQLEVADGVSFDVDYVTMTAAILAQRRKGKTYTGAVIAEELYALDQPWVALDPTGAWWGLRSSADGEHAGIPVTIIGGQHGDLPLEHGAGAFVADLVLDHPGWYVVDLSLIESRPAEREFATAFGERLLRRKMQAGMDFPLHLFIDEADMFLPQEKETKGDVALLAAYSGIVRRGGLHGLGSTLISQRPALINKNALTQLDVLLLLRLVAGNDQDAVRKNYVSRFMEKAQADVLMTSLASLPVGEGWFLEPGAEPIRITRAKVRERRTFNSSATPKAGERRVEPRVLADVDIDELRGLMAEAIERAQDDDPAELRRRLRAERDRAAGLEQAVEQWKERASEGEVTADAEPRWAAYFRELGWLPADEVPVPEAVPVLDDSTLTSLSTILDRGESLAARADEYAVGIRASFAQVAERVAEAKAPPAGRTEPAAEARVPPRPPRRERGDLPVIPEPARAPAVRPADGVTAPQQKILDALAWWDALAVRQPTLGQIAFVVGYHPRSKGFTNNLSALSTGGLIERAAGAASLTTAGRDAANYPTGRGTDREFQEAIYAQVGGKAAEILRLLVAENGEWVTVDDLAERMGYHPRSKGFTNNLSRLSGLGLADREPGRVRASDLCFLP